MGGEAIRAVTDLDPDSRRRKIGVAVSAGILGASLLAARHPRLSAWPQAAVGMVVGGLGLLRAARPGATEDVPDRREP